MNNFLSMIYNLLQSPTPQRTPTDQRPDFKGPLGEEYTDPYGRRVYQSNVHDVPPVVMGRSFSPPAGNAQEPEFWMDPTKSENYYKYRANLPSNDSSPNQKIYYNNLLQALHHAHVMQAARNSGR